MDVRSLGFRTDLAIRRLGGSEVEDRGDHIVVRTPANPTFWWGNCIVVGDDFANVPRWLQAFTDAHPNAAHISIGLDAPTPDEQLLELYGATGLEAEITTVLVARQIDNPTVTPGVNCRALDGDADWQQALELMLAVNDESSDLFTRRKLAEWRQIAEHGHGAWFGAFVDGRMRSSLGLFAVGDDVARYQSVETHPDFRRRGLARQLIAAAAQQIGGQDFVIVADRDYHAAGLYRSLGFIDRDHQIELARSVRSA